MAWSVGTIVSFSQSNIEEILMAPHRDQFSLPPGFAVDIALEEEGAEWWLTVQLGLPYGGYVISASCERDYLGKFQINWEGEQGGTVVQWEENPPAELGFEPFDRVMVPMLVKDTEVRARLHFPDEGTELHGAVFFVLEPQCVPYEKRFKLIHEGTQWTAMSEPLRYRFD